MVNNKEVRSELSRIQEELQEALESLLHQAGTKLKNEERQEIEKECSEINEVLERLKSGLIWLSLFGKTSVGKSAVVNSLVDADIADVSVEHDKTVEATGYERSPWKIVDVPGIMGASDYEELAVKEANRAHGLIFVIDGEPYEDEIELFNSVHSNSPDTPTIVFVNKWDLIQNNMPSKEQEILRSRISQKMRKFVKSSEDIVYGSAMLYKSDSDAFERQELLQLLERLYESAGTLGSVMNVLDPANRASELNDNINDRVKSVRLKIARKFINIFGTAAAVGIVAPASTLTVYPALFTSMVFTVCKIMGNPISKKEAGKIMWSCLKTLGVHGPTGILAYLLVDAATTAFTPMGGVGFAAGGLAALGGMGWYSYSQTVKLGEMTLDYIENDFSWGDQRSKEVIAKSKAKAEEHYVKMRSAW